MAVHLPKGTRDFMPTSMRARLSVIGTLRDVFTRFGFEPLETPAFERIETLMGKYGDEGEKLIYRILKRGAGASRGETDLALRYDLTVPLARVVAMQRDLRMPFKRYQIQPVWRADRPQRGRFREFTQCDVDIVGCAEMSADAECLAVVDAALRALGFSRFTIRLNHRELLSAMVAHAGASDRETTVLVAIDKLDKIGWDGVLRELSARGIDDASAQTLAGLLRDGGEAPLAHLETQLGEAAAGAIADIRQVLSLSEAMGVDPAVVRFDPTLARGLSYYTGPVFEVELEGAGIGSVAGGGRYDGLVGMFSGRAVPAVGVALGLARILGVMTERGMLGDTASAADALVTVFSEELRPAAARAAAALRAAGISTRLWLDAPRKMGKQFKQAHARGIPWVLTLGPNEAAAGQVRLKHLPSGEQFTDDLDAAIQRIRAADPGAA